MKERKKFYAVAQVKRLRLPVDAAILERGDLVWRVRRVFVTDEDIGSLTAMDGWFCVLLAEIMAYDYAEALRVWDETNGDRPPEKNWFGTLLEP